MMNKEQKITNNIKVPNKDLEVLKKHFSHCFTKNGNFDIEKFKQELSENEIDISKESYGMDWLGKSYARLLASDEANTLLKEDEEWNKKEENKNSQNLLIKGDNLEVLKHLSNGYYEKVKMIYIDPPYNTGSDGFVYQDDRKFTYQELSKLAGIDEEKAKRILEFTQSKSNSHSAWLTFMYPRLYIAKQLLKDDGVIFVSIDDNEVVQLRLLMDDIFGEENFVAELIWKSKSGGANDSRFFATDQEYILVYSKNIDKANTFMDKDYEVATIYNYEDEKGKYALDRLDKQSIRYSKTLDYEIVGPDGKIYTPKHKDPNKPNATWRWSKKTVEDRYDELVFKNGNVYTKNYKKNKSIARTLLTDEKYGRTRTGKTEVFSLFNVGVFSSPKPSKLIKHLLKITTSNNKNDLILDFFAGSGTTADAVMQLNAEDGGNRKYILVQLPEPIDHKKNKTAYDFVKQLLTTNHSQLTTITPTIFEITKERLIRSSKKIKEETIKTKIAKKEKEIKEFEGQIDIDGKDEKIKQLKAEIKALKNQDLGFKIFETMPIWEDYNFEADELTEELSLFDESKLTEDDLKALLITWKTYDGIPLTESLQAVDLGGYTAYYTSDKLYLINKGFKTENLKALLEKIDSDKKFNPTSIIAFGYHFESKNLREIAENIKSYANKKNIDIDFITRY